MPELKLFHFPGACSRVAMTALEHVGVPFEDEMVDLMAGDHKKPAYKATNPHGKVPALLIDGQVLTENLAIIKWLSEVHPQAGLLPKTHDALTAARQFSDLSWLGSAWHPAVRANRMPARWTTGDIAPVRERGVELLTPCIEELDARLEKADWWYDEWSILDVYFYWCYTTAEQGEFSLEGRKGIARHRNRVEAVPAFQRALDREKAAKARAEKVSA